MGMVAVAALAASARGVAPRLAITATRRRAMSATSVGRAVVPALQPVVLDGDIPALDVPGITQAFAECSRIGCGGIGSTAEEESDDRHRRLLRARRERPRGRRAAEQTDEGAPPHSITSSASATSIGGTSIPSAFAVFALITSSNLVDCCTGKSAGLVPLRIRPV